MGSKHSAECASELNLLEAGSDSGVIMDAAEQVGLARRVARLLPLIHIKG